MAPGYPPCMRRACPSCMKDSNREVSMTEGEADRTSRELDEAIDRWSQELDRIKDHPPAVDADGRMAFERRMGELEEKRQGARARVDALRSAGDLGGPGSELADGARAAVEDLGAAVERARTELGSEEAG
jgi:hypothetical protein